MRQIDAYFTYLKEIFDLWRQAQHTKLMMWVEAKKTCLKLELKKDAIMAKSRGEMLVRVVYLKLLGKIVMMVDGLVTRGNSNQTY